MLATDRDALICDMAETYGIYDLYALPAHTIATLAAGLRGNSRIMMEISDISVSPETYLMAAAVDRLSTLVWFQSEDGHNNRNRPSSIVSMLNGDKAEKETDVQSFASGEEFERQRSRLLKGVRHGEH